MGDAQSAQREGKKDAAAEGESGKVEDAQTEQNTEDKLLKNKGQISEINGKADDSIAEVNGHCEDEIAAEAILSPEDSETEKPLKEDTPFENVEVNEKESPNEADANEEVPLEMTEIDAKQNDINESFRRFFSNIGLKLTVKRGSSEIATDVPDETNKEEPNRPEDIEDDAKETKSENAEDIADVNIAKETCDNDSTTCPTLTDAISEDVLENAEEKTTETNEEAESDNATTSPVKQDTHQDAPPEEEPHSTSPSCPEEEVVVSPIKRFFTTGIFSGLRKKKKPAEDETTEKELVDMVKKEVEVTTEQTVQDQQQDKEEISLGVEAAAAETEHKENELKEEVLSAGSAQTTDEGKSSITDPSAIIVTEPGILSSQEKDKIQASPLKRLLSGSSLKKLSKKQRGRKSSDAKLSDSGEHVSDQLMSSTESAENQKEEGPAQPSAEAAGEEDSAWASFKKLVTPKKRVKRSSLSNEETQIPGLVEEPKPSEGEQISDHSTEEGKKRKDSSVSWEAVLCGSGRRRSRKTSDSEDETPQIDNNDNKKDGGSKHGAELPLESSNENEGEILAPSPKQAGSPSEGDGGSTWKSFKRLVTPKRKAKDEDESKDNIQSDGEVSQDEPSFSIKKLLPGRKKRKSAEKQDQVSSDEADKDVASGDEDSETPAVVPLSEFDTVETEVHIQTQADIESHIPEEADYGLQQDLLDQIAKPVLPCDSTKIEAMKVQDNDDALEKQESATPATNEEPDDTESTSKHQQLSDIPEEGIITETPASVNEEAARDDTMADDLIEITSEAITAPEPLDITLADDTEMISAVSQLSSESSKTSGNATPVPAEYDMMETDMLLHHTVETISISPEAVPVGSDNLSSERIVGSVSHKILEPFGKEEHTILEIHRRLDATAIVTGLNAEELAETSKLTATAQTESISEINDSVSTEIVSEVPTEEFETAEIAVDEVNEAKIIHTEESVKELERTDESQLLVERLSEINVSVSTDTLPEGEEIVPDEGSLLETYQAETELPQMDSEETDSAAIVADETKDGAMEQEVQTLTEMEDQIMHNITDQIQVEDQDQLPAQVEELQELATLQATTLDSEEGSVQSLEKKVISEDTPAAVTFEPKEKTVAPTEVNVETDAAKTEHIQVQDRIEAVQASTLDSEDGSVQSPEVEVKSEDIPPAETAADEPKQTTEHLTEVSDEPKNKELSENAVKTENVQEPMLDSGEDNVHSLEKEVISEDVAETITDGPKEEIIPLTEVNLEPVDASRTEHVQEVSQAVQAATLDSEVGSLSLLEKEVISENIPGVETITDEPKQETEVSVEHQEKLPVEAIKTDPEVLPADVKYIVTETKPEEEASVYMHAVTESPEGASAQEPERQILLEGVSRPAANNVNASVTDEIESEAVAELGHALEKTEDQKTETISEDAEVENKLQTLTAVHVSSVTEQSGNVQVLERTVFPEETPAPCVDNAAVTDEPRHEAHLSSVQVSVMGEKESELPGTEIRTVAAEHAMVAQVVTCNLKEVSAAIPGVLIEKTSDIIEPLIDIVANELVIKEEVEAATPLAKDDEAETAVEGSMVVMMRVPSLEFEDNHRIQVQVADVDVKSAEAIVDSVLEVGVTEAKDVIDICLETVKKVDNLSATPEIEDQLINEENKVTIQEVIQHVKENLSETVFESVDVNLEQEVIKQPDAVTDVGESLSHQVEDQKAMEDSITTFKERQDEVLAVISEDSATEQQVSEDVSIHDHKDDLEEVKAECEKSETGITAEEFISSSEELVVKKTHEQVQMTQIPQGPLVTPSNTGLVVPSNTGIISSIGNVESPSSLSLEFKLNIQFGQTKAPASPPPTSERIEPVKQTEVSEVGVQAVEVEELVKTQKAESQNQTEINEVSVQATEILNAATNLDSTERAVITTQPVLLDVGIQALEIVEPTEQIKPTERAIFGIQATEAIQPVRQTAKRGVLLSQPVLSEVCNQETKAEESVKQIEEENEQDVWMDAEEVIYTQEETEVTLIEVEEPLESQTGSGKRETAGLEHEVGGKESQQEKHKTGGTCEIDSEGEDFAVALEHPEIATASITTMEWD